MVVNSWRLICPRCAISIRLRQNWTAMADAACAAHRRCMNTHFAPYRSIVVLRTIITGIRFHSRQTFSLHSCILRTIHSSRITSYTLHLTIVTQRRSLGCRPRARTCTRHILKCFDARNALICFGFVLIEQLIQKLTRRRSSPSGNAPTSICVNSLAWLRTA